MPLGHRHIFGEDSGLRGGSPRSRHAVPDQHHAAQAVSSRSRGSTIGAQDVSVFRMMPGAMGRPGLQEGVQGPTFRN